VITQFLPQNECIYNSPPVSLSPTQQDKMAFRFNQILILALLLNFVSKSVVGDLLHEDNLFGLSLVGRKCPMDCTFNSTSAVAISQDDFIGKVHALIKENRMDLVTPNRLRATALLTKSAILSCTHGDIVETGVFSGGSSAMIMRVLLDFDRCNRKFWAYDSFDGNSFILLIVFHPSRITL
jgi:Macrocin-O-methyltransferase (TylF)